MRKLQSQGVHHHIIIVGAGCTPTDPHVAEAIETLVRRSRASLSEDRSPKDPYR